MDHCEGVEAGVEENFIRRQKTARQKKLDQKPHLHKRGMGGPPVFQGEWASRPPLPKRKTSFKFQAFSFKKRQKKLDQMRLLDSISQ